MMQFTAGMVRMLNGAPLSVLVALMIDQQPHSATWLEGVTGYSDKPVMAALGFLVEMGYVTHNSRYAWQLAAGIQQLPIMADQIEAPAQEPEPKDSEIFRLGIIPSPLVASSLTINQELEEKDQLLESRADSEKIRVAENNAALEDAGIGEPKRSKLAGLPHVTPRMIRYHQATCEKTGQAIYRIEHNWRVPEDWIDSVEDDGQPDLNRRPHDPEPTEPLTPLSDAQLQAWTAAVDRLPLKRVERLTWMPRAPAGVSTETPGELVVRVGNSYSAEWFRMHALEVLQTELGCPVRLEVGNG